MTDFKALYALIMIRVIDEEFIKIVFQDRVN